MAHVYFVRMDSLRDGRTLAGSHFLADSAEHAREIGGASFCEVPSAAELAAMPLDQAEMLLRITESHLESMADGFRIIVSRSKVNPRNCANYKESMQ